MTPAQVMKHYLTQAAAAAAADAKQPAVARWVKVGRVPPLAQLKLEAHSKGVLKADSTICRGATPSRS